MQPAPGKVLIWFFLIIDGIIVIALNPWWHRRPGETAADVTKTFLAFVVFIGIPILMTVFPIYWYGRRHGWGPTQYRWMTLGVSLVFMAYLGLILHYPIDVILFPMALAGIPLALFIIGLGRAEGSKPGAAMWFVATVLTFIILLAIAGVFLAPQKAHH